MPSWWFAAEAAKWVLLVATGWLAHGAWLAHRRIVAGRRTDVAQDPGPVGEPAASAWKAATDTERRLADGRPNPLDLWREADGDWVRYGRLMVEHGYAPDVNARTEPAGG